MHVDAQVSTHQDEPSISFPADVLRWIGANDGDLLICALVPGAACCLFGSTANVTAAIKSLDMIPSGVNIP